MTAQPVAASPTDIAPPRAADPVVAATNDFAQLLSDTTAPATAATAPSTSGTNSTGSATTSTTTGGTPAAANGPAARTAKKNDDAGSTPTLVVVALPVQQQTPPPKTQATDPAPTQAAAAAATDAKTVTPGPLSNALPSGVDIPTAPAANANDGTAAPAATTAANGANAAPRADLVAAASAPAPLPAGAAETNARIAVGPPSYFSQPNVMLTGAPRPATAAPDDGTATDDDADTSSVATTATTDISAKGSAPATVALQIQWHDASSTDTSSGMPPNPGTASDPSAAPTSDATSFSLPLSNDNQATAPITTASTAATTAPNLAPPPVYEQVAFSLRQAADGDGGLNTINIQLKPASLGAIQVKLDVGHDGKISAVISADRSDTLNLLRQDSQGLEQALRDAGLKADSGSLSFNLRGEQQSFAQNSSNGSAGAPASASQSSPSGSGAPTPRYSRHLGALDIEV